MTIELGSGDKLALLAEGLDQLDIGLTVFDRDLVMVAANTRFQQLLNFPDVLCRPGASMQDALRYNAEQGEYGPGAVDDLVRPRLELARQFLPHRFERVRPDGSIIEVCGQPLPSGGMITTYTDVTIPRQREQALRELKSELEQRVEARTAELRHREAELARKAAMLESVISNVNQGISYINKDLVIEMCNTKFGELLGLPPELCQPGVSFEQLAYFNAERGEYGTGNVEEAVQARIAIAKQFLPHRFERIRPADGSTLEIMGMPTPDGGMVTTYLDVSERKATERALQRERERLVNILKGTNAGAWEVNLQTGELQVNDRWIELTGYQLEDLSPFSLSKLGPLIHLEDQEPAQTAFVQHLKGRSPYYSFEYRFLRKNGNWVWLAAHGQVATRTADGRAEWMAGVFMDIGERKVAEQKIRTLNETLEERVTERSVQLSAAMQTLHRSQEELARSAAKATLSTLVASVTHELATPLSNSLITASTCTDLSRRLQAEVDSGQLKRSELLKFLKEVSEGGALIERNLHRALGLVQNFKQVAADQASEQRRSFDLKSVIQEVLDTLSPSLKRHRHLIVVDVPADIVLDSFPGALGQVLINLINNAYLHAFEGRADGTVRIAGHALQDWVHIQVSDDGAGMHPDLLAQLFQPFFSTKIGRGGTGLGMTIVENLVQKTLGGTLEVKSSPGQGSTFALRIPLQVAQGEDFTFDAVI
ncbi:MAG: PAS domain S-box protein [Curvibacter sp.]|nr:MAG: PAS domain S-box protein [Curvibacter sp.]